MTLLYGMLLTRLVKHIRVSHPHAFLDDLYLVDHMMIPLSKRRVFRIMPGGKRPWLPTPTPFESSDSTSYSSHQEEENDPVNNFTLDPIPYINQLSPIEGGESSKFKQTKGMFKCLGHFLSNLRKKNKSGPFGDKGTDATGSTGCYNMTLLYGMLLTRLVKYIRVSHPHAFLDDLYLVDHIMIPLSKRRVFRIMPGGKRPWLPTPTPSESSDSTSSSSHQEEENDPVNNFTLDPIPYINQLSPIEGGESSEFKQTKGMFKCLGHFLSNLRKKKK
nr:hypothetical protein [Tanacetum cinerariifolium]